MLILILMEKNKISERNLEVLNPYNQEVIGNISCAKVDDVEKVIHHANEFLHETIKKMPAHERSNILRKTAEFLEERSQEFIEMLYLKVESRFKKVERSSSCVKTL